MDVLEILKSDHERVASLFDQFESTEKRAEQWRLFQMIRRELEAHSHAEESILYPAFQRYDNLKELISESFEEHAEVKRQLTSIAGLGRESAEVEQQVVSLRESVDHHVNEEETRLFPEVRRIMKRAERETLGRHVQALKQEKMAA